MNKTLAIGIFILLLGFAVCLADNGGANTNRLLIVDLEATALKGNLLGDPILQKLLVYLPPSYYETDQKYPVVYFLHCYGGNYLDIGMFKDDLDQQFKKGTIPEFILVGVNGNNKLNGSFFVNSPVTGNWEDYLVNDVVRYVDSTIGPLVAHHPGGSPDFRWVDLGRLIWRCGTRSFFRLSIA